ncbi:MAG: hypothetical protein IKI50_07980 [Clostridia bacterium]|nr:hypothetical protein [Clostridia bacterium]
MDVPLAVLAMLCGLAGWLGGRREAPVSAGCMALLAAETVILRTCRDLLPGAVWLTELCVLAGGGAMLTAFFIPVCGRTVSAAAAAVLWTALFNNCVPRPLPLWAAAVVGAAAGWLLPCVYPAVSRFSGACLWVGGLFFLMQPLHGFAFTFSMPPIGRYTSCFLLLCVCALTAGRLLVRRDKSSRHGIQ